MATTHHLYFWNLENLFDISNSPTRPEWLKKKLKSELDGWTTSVLNKKIANLTSIISKLNNGKGPDILGVCEIENEAVVKKLMDKVSSVVGRNYKILHKDTKDKRGIDVAFIYDEDMYTDDGHMFSLEVQKRSPTRDLFQVNLTTVDGNELILIGNHWPSRMGGKYGSEPYRMMVGEILSYWIERIHEIKFADNGDKNPSIILMGDFNDNPFDRSLTEYLRSTSNLQRVKNSNSHIMFNLMHQFLDSEYGTHVYGSDVGILDQFIVSEPLVVNNPSSYPFQVMSTDIIHFPEMIKGGYNTPIRFSRPSKSDYDENGFSDHLPIELVIEEN